MSACASCGGTHYGSPVCPYQCARCGNNTGTCTIRHCPRNERWEKENIERSSKLLPQDPRQILERAEQAAITVLATQEGKVKFRGPKGSYLPYETFARACAKAVIEALANVRGH